MGKMIRIGVIGGGTFGQNHLLVFKELESSGKIKLAALAEINDEVRTKSANDYTIPTYQDYREMLEKENLDAVTVATPDHLHGQITLDVLDHGLHCMVEKPLDVAVERCRQIVSKAEEKDRLLQVDFHKRFDPYHIEMRECFLEGKFGEVEYGYAWMEDQLWVPVRMLRNWSAQSSPVWFLGVHMYDTVRWILNNPDPINVYATGTKKKLVAMGIDTYDSIQTHVEFDGGIHVTFNNCWILPDNFEAVVHQGIKLVGSEGIFECDSQYRGGRGCLKGESMKTWNLGIRYRQRDKHNRIQWRGYFYAAIADFADNLIFLRDGGRVGELDGLYPSGREALTVTQIACAAHESISQGKSIKISK